jgi:hypothetical protein
MVSFELVYEEIRQIYFVESVIRVGDDFWAHPAKLTRRGCTAFVRFWKGVAGHHYAKV